ncbi:MAG: septum site-determining protein MinC [Steroidobacteraceae bacterium]|jgi:septum site-determining protein MinC|nr:septum site-determining protein MinC [Steroidobacteraceae bacterium]
MLNPTEARPDPALDVRFGPVGLVQVRVHRLDPESVLAELHARIAAAPRFFDRTAVALDLSLMTEAPPAEAVAAVLAAIRRAGLVPIGLTHAGIAIDVLARTLDLPVLTQFRSASKSKRAGVAAVPGDAPAPGPADAVGGGEAAPAEGFASRAQATTASNDDPPSATGAYRPLTDATQRAAAEPDAPPAAEPAVVAAPPPTLLHVQPVRSGQRVYARHRDLVVTATVGAGAEVMADGCVHVYGALRGRAMAGARGDANARVFCQEFRAELVSIAGVFRVFETIPPELAGHPVQAWLDGENLRFARIGG